MTSTDGVGTTPAGQAGLDVSKPMPSRRALVAGAAWAVPVVTVATAAPAFAASCTGCPSIPFGTIDGSGNVVSSGLWSYSDTGLGGGGSTGFSNGQNTTSGPYVGGAIPTGQVAFMAQRDPIASNNSASMATSFCIPGGTKLTFTFQYASNTTQPLWQQMTARLKSSTGTVLGSFVYSTNGLADSDYANNVTASFSYTTPAGPSATYTFEYYFVMEYYGYNFTADDIAVTAPTITCG